MWLVWFWKIGGPQERLTQSINKKIPNFNQRSWSRVHYLIVGFVLLMLISSAYSVTTITSNASKRHPRFLFIFQHCYNCMAAQNTWDNAISTAWSLAAIGLLIAAAVIIKVDRKITTGAVFEESE